MTGTEAAVAIVIWTPTVVWVIAGAVGHVLDRRAQQPASLAERGNQQPEPLPSLPIESWVQPSYNGTQAQREP